MISLSWGSYSLFYKTIYVHLFASNSYLENENGSKDLVTQHLEWPNFGWTNTIKIDPRPIKNRSPLYNLTIMRIIKLKYQWVIRVTIDNQLEVDYELEVDFYTVCSALLSKIILLTETCYCCWQVTLYGTFVIYKIKIWHPHQIDTLKRTILHSYIPIFCHIPTKWVQFSKLVVCAWLPNYSSMF